MSIGKGTRLIPVRCEVCGKFISNEDLATAHYYFEPLNEFGPEVSEWMHSDCANEAAEAFS